MTWHGPGGEGKTFASRRLSITSRVHFLEWMDTTHPRMSTGDSRPVPVPVDRIVSTIEHMLWICDRRVFVFDDAHRFPREVLDDLGQFISCLYWLHLH